MDVKRGNSKKAVQSISEKLNEMGARIEFTKLRTGDFDVDDSYQRDLKPSKVRNIVRNFEPLSFGVITVALRDDGSYLIIDGQNRVKAMQEMAGADHEIWCEVILGTKSDEEAWIFHTRNQDRTRLSSNESFKSDYTSGKGAARLITAITESSGFSINTDTGERSHGRIAGVGALTKVFNSYSEGHLKDVLDLIAETWGYEEGPQSGIIRGVATMLSIYSEPIDKQRFVAACGRYHMQEILDDARAYRKATGVASERAVASILVSRYNNGLWAGNRLQNIDVQIAVNEASRRGEGA